MAVEVLEERQLLSAVTESTLAAANAVVLPGNGFNALQFTPDGRLVQLLWLEQTSQLIYRERGASGGWCSEIVLDKRSFSSGSRAEFR